MSQTPGTSAQPGFSPDGHWWWDGQKWLDAAQAPPEARAQAGLQAPPATPPAAPAPVAGLPPSPAAFRPLPARTWLYQFGGSAFWSMLFGLAAIVVPLVANRYFILLPIFGFIGAVQALRAGRVIGAVVGIILNILGGLMSLLASGIIPLPG